MLPNEHLHFFAQYIERELGIIYSEVNYFQLNNRLEEIAKAMNVQRYEDLYRIASDGIHGHFKQLLLDTATNNETSFFRDPKVFRAIENRILPQILQNKPPLEKVLIWSAASSTGQEALSIAMLFNEWMKKNNKTFQFSIIGTDISERVLLRAKKAVYSQLEVQRGLPTPLLIKYFTKDQQNYWTAKSEITQNITYRSLNLKDPFHFPQPFDLVLCRNVLIYQNVDSKKQILTKISQNMATGAYLLMGAGESLFGLSDSFQQNTDEGAVLYRIKDQVLRAA